MVYTPTINCNLLGLYDLEQAGIIVDTKNRCLLDSASNVIALLEPIGHYLHIQPLTQHTLYDAYKDLHLSSFPSSQEIVIPFPQSSSSVPRSVLSVQSTSPSSNNNKTYSMQLIHNLCGHINIKDIRRTIDKGLLGGINSNMVD